MSELIKYIDTKDFEYEVLTSGSVVVDFYSTECPPCEALASKFESLAEVYGEDIKFIKIHRQENRDLATMLGVSSSPTLLFYENGNTGCISFSGRKYSSAWICRKQRYAIF